MKDNLRVRVSEKKQVREVRQERIREREGESFLNKAFDRLLKIDASRCGQLGMIRSHTRLLLE